MFIYKPEPHIFLKPSAFIKLVFLDSFLDEIMIFAINPILKYENIITQKDFAK